MAYSADTSIHTKIMDAFGIEIIRIGFTFVGKQKDCMNFISLCNFFKRVAA